MALLLTSCGVAFASPLTCPAVAPDAWGLKNAPLLSVRILSAPDAVPPDKGTLPIIAPEQEKHGSVIEQRWNMNVDAPKFGDFVDCLYRGTERFVRLRADQTRSCVARWRVHGNDNTLISFRCE